MKILAISCISLLAFAGPIATDAWAENLFAPLNKVYDVDSNSSVFGARRQGTGRMNANLLSKIFNPDRGGVNQVPLQMLDGSQSTLQLRGQPTNNVDGIQIVSGIVDGESHNMATLVNNNGELRGRIWKDGKLFRLNGDQSGEYKLSEINIARLPEGKDAIELDLIGEQSREKLSDLPPQTEPIDLLMFITERAIKELGGKDKAISEMQLLISETNNIYKASGATDGLMFRSVGILPFPLKEHDDIELGLVRWRSNKGVISIREKYGADLVTFITSPNDGKYCGVGFIGPDASDRQVYPQLGYSISVLQCALTSLTFAHELGHNMGARHDRRADPTKGDNHGYINFDEKWRTVMAYNLACWEKSKKNCPRIPVFSNPDLKHKNNPVGIAKGQPDAADNVAAIRQNKRIVASYKPRADAKTSSSGSRNSNNAPVRQTVNKVGGIILEKGPSLNANSDKRNGKERKIKW